jgi:hypothetical protein
MNSDENFAALRLAKRDRLNPKGGAQGFKAISQNNPPKRSTLHSSFSN